MCRVGITPVVHGIPVISIPVTKIPVTIIPVTVIPVTVIPVTIPVDISTPLAAVFLDRRP